MKTTILERIYKRLLNESVAGSVPDVSGYGVLYNRGTKSAAVYNIDALKSAILGSEKLMSGGMKRRAVIKLLQSSIVSFVSIAKPKDPCHNAYQIKQAVGSGKLAYACAYAMSPSGLMMSDRNEISPKAVDAWTNMARKSSRDRLELDDISLPKEKRKTPDFKGDDCKVWKEKEGDEAGAVSALNYAYRGEGWERDVFNKMRENHANFVKSLKSEVTAIIKANQPDVTKEGLKELVTSIVGSVERVLEAGENVFFVNVKDTRFRT